MTPITPNRRLDAYHAILHSLVLPPSSPRNGTMLQRSNSIKPLRPAITPTYMGRTETDKGWSCGTTCLEELTL